MTAIDEALRDSSLLGAALGDWRSWSTWLAVLRAAFGLSLNEDELRQFMEVAGDRQPPGQRVRELWAIIGRRAGKSKVAAAIAVYLAVFVKHKLSRGERGMVLVLAGTTEQARVVFGYARAFIEASPILRQEIESFTRSEIRLRNGISVGIHPNSFRSIRGRTLCACVCDEVAIWRDEQSAAPDIETYRAVLPSLLTTKGMLVGISTGYRRVGLLYQKYRDHFGQADSDTLVVQGSTQQFNTTVDEAEIAAQIAADPAAAVSEWSGQFRTDLQQFLDDSDIDRAFDHDRPSQLPFRQGTRYSCFMDLSSGRHDASTCAIGHKEGERIIVDVLIGREGKFDPIDAAREFGYIAKSYGCREIVTDTYSVGFVESALNSVPGMRQITSDLPRSKLYLEGLPVFARGLIGLPVHKKLERELRLLERRVSRSGEDRVDHPQGAGASDDFANSVFGLIHVAVQGSRRPIVGAQRWAEAAAIASRMPHWSQQGQMKCFF